MLVQHYTATGAVNPRWPSSGAALAYSQEQRAPVVCAAGAGGVLVASLSYAGFRFVSVGRLDSTGALARSWPAGGVPVCWVNGNQDAPGIVPDGSGGAIVVWQDSRNGSFEEVYAQRVSAAGAIAPGWPADGKPVCSLPSAPGLTRYSGYRVQRYSSVVTDGSGGALIAWQDARSDTGDIYVQHLLPDGSLAPGWPENGLQVCTAPGNQVAPSLAPDGAGGAFVTWQDARSGSGWKVYAQHVTGSGGIASGWAADGVPLCTAPGDHGHPCAALDGAGGAIVAWQSARCVPQILASHVGADGAVPTAPGPAPVSASVVSTFADSGTVRLEWQVTGISPATTIATVYCRQVDSPWMAVAHAAPDPDGRVIYCGSRSDRRMSLRLCARIIGVRCRPDPGGDLGGYS